VTTSNFNANTGNEIRLLSPGDVEALPNLEYLIQGILPSPAFGVIFGPPGSGKSFVALSMALAIASGTNWLGRKVTKGKVLYVAAEGVYGMKLRLQANRAAREVNDDNLRFIGMPFDVRDKSSVEGICKLLKANGFSPNLIVIDTLARVAVGADENSAKDMGQVVEGLEMLRRETGATILSIHHSRKDGGVERGSSALRGASDVMISCTSEDATKLTEVTFKCEKMKDDEPFSEFGISFEKIDLDGGKSSLIASGTVDLSKKKTKRFEQILQIMVNDLKNTPSSYTDICQAFIASPGQGRSKSTFDRSWKILKKSDDIRIEKHDRQERFCAVEPEKYNQPSDESKAELNAAFNGSK
tara:strand:- start:2497 stop:3564 length:1068 start_codon:yes stop_codon:yes gene_type:complete